MLMNINGDSDRRARALKALRSPDESRDDVLRKFVRLASQALGIPGSFISVLDDEHQHVQAAHNFALTRSSRQDSLCRHAVDNDSPVVVPDTWLDARFVTHPLITGAPYIRFYAGVPLKNREGIVLGTLCVTDTAPHPFGAGQVTTLKLLAALVMSFLEAWHSAGFADPVTGLPNRQRLIRDLQYLAAAGDSTPRRLVLIDCIDMPRAYELARSMGMGPVESLLKDVATLLPLRLRPATGELLYTVATGRFAVLTRNDSRLSADWVAGRLEGISADLGDGIAVALSTHTGEVTFTPGDIPAQEALRRAVSALHEAIGRNVPAMRFSEATDSRHTQDFTLMNDLAAALREDRGLWLAYQPKVCLHTGRPVGLEALVRWRHPVRGELSPALFVPLAEQTELLSTLTAWVTDRAIARLARLRNSCIQLPVTINVSCRDFSREGFADALEAKMIRAKLPTSLLGIECLETERIIESPAAMQGLEMLKLRGFGISLDDFGTGYSNISYLRRMPLDVIKLDRTLISEISSDTASRIIARSIIAMLKELDYTVLAEGVEDAETVTALTQYGCDQAQGFFYSRPLPEGELDEWLGWKLRGQC
ncbi:TPA: GGDEF and EAL domain-containing protein [Serratia marcescens]|uniref:putative bifunctional diguanylate cyclase/phosphodiesterase n=1 Tax=Pantoea dispersa TaxID=59814 RepID=UPI001A357D5B|nr:GGDEF and EAL domain-containing protein [Pantoea dispersa]QZY94340.1 GGDEF and EAL domain-containing protein [Pantoea dispersa]HAT4499348.1 GGDEF and EAL domain-containing protein [Serratia marcescens]HAT4512941.1 GGDEF and EAL domain-containing protein [Serratia marcescens]HAT4536494.1 GGDEF and EAL domain-containing protein [Serratia marcescens]